MADLSLRIKSDFEQAERDFKALQSSSESARATMERFSNSFKGEQIDKFVEKNRMAALGVTATQGSLAGMQKEAAGLEREIQRLIGRGIDPQSAAIQKLRGEYDRLQSDSDRRQRRQRSRSPLRRCQSHAVNHGNYRRRQSSWQRHNVSR